MLVRREGTGFIKTITALIAFPFCPFIRKRMRRNVYDRRCANSNGAGNERRGEEYTGWGFSKDCFTLQSNALTSSPNMPAFIVKLRANWTNHWSTNICNTELASEKTRVGWCHWAGTVQLAPKARLMACTQETHPPQHKNCTTVTSKQRGGNECWLEKPPSPGKWLS